MANEVTTRQGTDLAVNNDEFYARLTGEFETLKGGNDGKAYMKFNGNTGDFSYGSEGVELPVGTHLVMNPLSAERGWVIWVGGQVAFQDMKGMGTGLSITKAQLPDFGPYSSEDGPTEQYTVDFKTLEEPLVEMVFQANNGSKRNALAALLKDYGKTYKMHKGFLPVIQIDEKEFEGKGEGGRKFTKHAPMFKIVDWISQEELATMSEGAPSDYEQAPVEEAQPEAEAAPAPAPAPQQTRVAAAPRTAARVTNGAATADAGARKARF